MALKERRQRKSDFFRPWDDASASTSVTSANHRVPQDNELAREQKSARRELSSTRNLARRIRHDNESSSSLPSSTKSSTEVPSLISSPHIPVTFSAFPRQHYATFPPLQGPFESHFSTAAALSSPHINLFPYANGNFFSNFATQGVTSRNHIDQSSAESRGKKSQQQRKKRPKRFQCPHCHVSFSNNGQLSGHIRTHTGKTASLYACSNNQIF